MGAMDVCFGCEIGAYTMHPNFRSWKMFVALPRTKYSGEVI
jgi:hypothetical protein